MSDRFACAICLCFDSEVTWDYFVCTKCGHLFHYSCIKSAIDGHAYRKCPVCRKPVSTSSLTRLYGIESPAVKTVEVATPARETLCFEEVRLEFGSNGEEATITTTSDRTSAPLAELHFIESPNTPSDSTFHIAVVGNDAVGKSSIYRKFVTDQFSGNTPVTIGINLLEKGVRVGDNNIKLCLWDVGYVTPQQFQLHYPLHLRKKHAVLMVYSVADAETFDSMECWNEITKEHGPEDAIRIIVGNKCDLEECREVPRIRGEELGERLGIPFFETSAKEGKNVETVFRCIITKLLTSSELVQEGKAAVLASTRRRSSHLQASRVSSSRKCTIM
ncbi:unnamed protein product [Allacma fusca]|uniref:RING-type domain-containing protein n=1 Tax=Allacma fusca TaxID=39272 RepID=A0A8J2LCG5_9HEXA|nr:unnamed protein product [Allacma fusca]